MPRRLHYIAQPFSNGRPGQPYPFLCAVDAEDGGAILAREADGVLVYQQWVDDEADEAGPPDVLQVIGEVPSGAVSIDPDGRDPWLDDAA